MEVSFLFIFVLFIILALIGLATEAMRSFMNALPDLIAGAVIAIITYGLHRFFQYLRKTRQSNLYMVCEAAMLCSITLGIIVIAGIADLDRCNRWLNWFDDSLSTQVLTYIGIILLSNLIALTMACLLPWRRIGSLFPLLAILAPFVLCANALQVCTASYSDYITTDFESVSGLQEYRITEEAQIFYPSIFGDGIFPAVLPFKYTNESFEKDDIVYTVYHPKEYYAERGEAYAVVSDGTKGGLVLISNLEKVDKTQYRYSLETKTDDCSLYKADSHTVKLTYPKEVTYTSWKITQEIVAVIPAGEHLILMEGGVDDVSGDAYLRVYIPNGKLVGYIPRDKIAVIRTPVE